MGGCSRAAMIFIDLSTFFLALKAAFARASRSPKRSLWICIALFAVTGVYTQNIIGRLLDEVLLPDCRNTPLRPPVLITANPRGGSTYLYRLLGYDGESLITISGATTTAHWRITASIAGGCMSI
jgi:hypothetical protein